MRTKYLLPAILALLVVVGVGVAVGVSLGLFAPSPDVTVAGGLVAQTSDKRVPDLPPRGGPPARRCEFDRVEYDFGEMERFAKGHHTFVFTNKGQYPLKLAQGDTTCKCTLSKLAEDEIPPGKSADVTLEWDAKSEEERFRQSATIFTNDPNQRSITLSITGRLIQSLTVLPPELVFSNVTPQSQTEGKAQLLAQTSQPVKITGHDFEDKATAQFYDVKYSPLADGQVPKGFKSGWQVLVGVKPGLPFGAIQQKILLRTDLPNAPEQEIRVLGNVTNGVSVFGPGWLAEVGVLRMDVIKRRVGIKRDVKLLVSGPHRKEASFRRAVSSPGFCQSDPRCTGRIGVGDAGAPVDRGTARFAGRELPGGAAGRDGRSAVGLGPTRHRAGEAEIAVRHRRGMIPAASRLHVCHCLYSSSVL